MVRALVFTTMVSAAVAVLGGCAGCDVSCEGSVLGAPPPQVVVGRVVSVDERTVAIEAADGVRFDVAVGGGRPESLEIGSSYRFPLLESTGDEEFSSSLPSECDCGGPYITHPSGKSVDQSILGVHLDLAQIAIASIAFFAVVVVIWGSVRVLRARRAGDVS